ncbi:MAG TPA: glycoside hydrolase domain-containing protein, partial [Chitinophagaceae bacterium]|nr:glycoside hydrolase domain-containing protein [Chitinophagaceae bacterium]
KGIYYVYYMPYKNEGRSNYPKGIYPGHETTASDGWLSQLKNTSFLNASLQSVSTGANAIVSEFQAIDALNSFYPMEVIATAKETEELKAKHAGKAFLIFPEDREYSIRMKNDLPYRWIQKGVLSSFSGDAAKGEYYTYQLGVFALHDLEDVTVFFNDFTTPSGDRFPGSLVTCFNTNGISYDGKKFVKKINVPKNEIQPLWCGINIPMQIKEGLYSGLATVKAKNTPPQTVLIQLKVGNKTVKDGGINEPWKMTRLKWLNSTLAQENKVIAPYTPLQVKGNSIHVLGRKLELNADGFPEQIQTFFTPEMTGYSSAPKNILAKPMQWIAEVNGGKKLTWKNWGVKFIAKQPGTVRWKSTNTSDALKMEINASLEFDGAIAYEVKLTALKDIAFDNTSLQMPLNKAAAKYMMGLGQKGGYRPAVFEWKWDVANKNQDGAWIGDVNAGLQYSLRDEKYVRPLNTNFYLQKPLLLPSSWGNGDKGGISIREEGNTVWVNNYSGSRSMKKGEVLYYNFTFLITPFHPINTDFQWATRFYHSFKNPDTIKATGATVVNIHHANEINPWINYPFIEHQKMKDYIDEAHSKGLKVKIYNTVRELSNHAYETFALRSLGHEIYSPGKGGGFSWLQEHVDSDYIAAWFVPGIKDAAIVNSGMSRWHNYYVEGMNWLVNKVGIDGIYLDDVAFDRVTMKRIKRVLTQNGHPGIIDLHSANQYNKSDGFNNSANLYMEHFPYLNRLWFGEYFDYEKNAPDFFLTEVSGIPFGLMGEMLEGGGNPWRGMIYGMTNRMPWNENADPGPIWKIWDEFGMTGTAMIGYWSESCPVKTNNEKVLATVYKKKGTALISIASWADTNANVQLEIDWNKLGIDPAKATIGAPAVKNFQAQRIFKLNEAIPVEKGKGWILIIKE